MIRTVAYFTDSAAFGGAEQVLLTTIATLDRRRWRPVLLHYPEPGLAPLLEAAQRLEVTLRVVPRLEGKQAAVRMMPFVRELRAECPAVFHAHLTWPLACRFALLGAALARVPAIVATEHLFVEIPWRRSRFVQQLVCIGVDRYIAVSHAVARCLRRTLRFPAHKVQVIHNGILLDPFDRPANAAIRDALIGVTDRPIVLTPARLHEQKGHRYLLEAAALVPEALFVIAGDGPQRAALEAQARHLGLGQRVSFLGHRSDVPDLLLACDVVVLPSLFEGLPLTVLEGMAGGKPVIATAVGGTDEAVVPGQTGLLVPPADPVALAVAIQSVLSDPDLAMRLAMAGKARVQREFAAETMVHRVTQLYDELLSSGEESDDRR